jgi:hypothetical protein
MMSGDSSQAENTVGDCAATPLRLHELIEEALRESRRLVAAAGRLTPTTAARQRAMLVNAWVSLVRGSLTAWREQLQRRDRQLERRQAAEQQREVAMKERRRRELEDKKEGMMERIRLMKERALADAARSQDNVLMTQGKQQPAAASAPVLVPRVRLDSRGGGGGGGGEGSREGSSPVEEFSLLEAVEEATINKSAAAQVRVRALLVVGCVCVVCVCVSILRASWHARADDQAWKSSPLAHALAARGCIPALSARR